MTESSGSTSDGSKRGSLFTDITLCVWLLLVGLTFWSPYMGLALPIPLMTAFYGLFLLLFITTLTLRLLRHGGGGGEDEIPTADAVTSQKTERISPRGQ